jgi:hypothetical protein
MQKEGIEIDTGLQSQMGNILGYFQSWSNIQPFSG